MDEFDSPQEASDALKQGLRAAVAGDCSAARIHLWRVVNADPRHELAWQWLAKVAESGEEQEFCLARALALDPENERRRLSLLLAQEKRTEPGDDPVPDAKPAARGRCHFCDLPWAEEPSRCARCRAYQRLDDASIFLEPLDVDARLIRRFIERQPDQAEPDYAGRRVLLLAWLNLGDLLEAIGRLRELAHEDPHDEEVRGLLLAVSGRLDAIQLDSGFETEAVERPSLEELGMT